jgi:hypothetical protein
MEQDNLNKIENISENANPIENQEAEIKKKPETKQQIAYEEKFLERVRNMVNEYIFTEDELESEKIKLNELIEEEEENVSQSVALINEKIDELKVKLIEVETDNAYESEPENETENETIKTSGKDETLFKKIKDSISSEIKLNETKIQELQNNVINEDVLREKAREFIIDEQLKKFKNKYVIDHTPLGNVLMFYNHDKLAFEYYSDSTIPYRYLETVARKYVITYQYRPLYIDMEEQLKEYEKKMEEKEEKKRQEKEKLEQFSESRNGSLIEKECKKKDVFAKFKSYNKEAGTGRVNTAPPPKNSIPQNRMNVNINLNDKKYGNDKMLLKEKSNRYSYQGKFLNFNILQKIDKKVVDKKYALTFADFKKMNMNKPQNKN